MMTGLNQRIIDEIEASNYDPKIKSFLKSVLLFEFKHMNDTRPIFSKDYDLVITKYVYDSETEMEDE
jgi:hypothetical protein